MKSQCLSIRGLAAALAFGTPLLAQITLPGGVISEPFFLQQTYTTGMVGFTTNQTARINVLNLNPVPSATTGNNGGTATPTANCTVELRFVDDKGTLITQSVVPNFAPGASTSFDLPRASVITETTTRAEIRGVVVVNPSPTPVGSPATVGYCSVMTTLEVFDATGSTVSSTSDTRPLNPYAFPVFFGGGGRG
jgi:hypothetical protein